LIKAILFDFDGVLADTVDSHLAAWKQVFAQEGVEPEELTLRLNEGAPAYKIAQALALRSGRELTEEEAKEIAAEKNQIFRKTNKASVFKKVYDIIDHARSRGLKVGLVTGTALENLFAVLPEKLLQQFDYIVKDGDTKRGKPFPDPYLVAAEKLGVEPKECLVIENAPLGIDSAKAAGAFCVALATTLSKEHLQKADVILKDHSELLKKFDDILEQAK